MSFEGSWSSQRKPTHSWGGQANCTQKDPSWDFNQGLAAVKQKRLPLHDCAAPLKHLTDDFSSFPFWSFSLLPHVLVMFHNVRSRKFWCFIFHYFMSVKYFALMLYRQLFILKWVYEFCSMQLWLFVVQLDAASLRCCCLHNWGKGWVKFCTFLLFPSFSCCLSGDPWTFLNRLKETSRGMGKKEGFFFQVF